MTSRTSVRSLCAVVVCAACVQSPPKAETAAAEAAPSDASLARAQAFSDALARGNIDEIGSFYDDKALMVGPASLSPVTSREGVLAAHRALMQKEKVVYYHLRQPRAAPVDGQTS